MRELRLIPRTLFLLVALVLVAAPAWAQEAIEPAPATGVWAWLLTTKGRVLVGGGIALVVAILKLLPLKNALPRTKQIVTAFIASLAGLATAWAAGGGIWEAIGGAGAMFLLAMGWHEGVSRIVSGMLPFVVLIPGVGPTIAIVLRALLSPASPPVEQLQAEAELKKATNADLPPEVSP